MPACITKLAGVAFNGRQENIANLRAGERVWLFREPENAHDGNAILVQGEYGDELGYIPRGLAAQLAPVLDEYGEALEAEVLAVVGSCQPGMLLGVEIGFDVPSPLQVGEPKDEMPSASTDQKPVFMARVTASAAT